MIAFNSANRCGIGEAEVELLLGLLLLLKILFLAGDVGGPEEPGGLDFQRPDGGVVLFDEPLGASEVVVGRRARRRVADRRREQTNGPDQTGKP